MKIRIRTKPRTFLTVDVMDDRCPKRPCFWYREHYIHSSVGMSGCGSRASGQFECGLRDGIGCPQPIPEVLDSPRCRKLPGLGGKSWEEIEK